MEYHHYSDLCVPSDHHVPDPYAAEFVPPYMMPGQSEAEYGIRNSVLVDGGDRFGVSSVIFDKYEELVWMGNQGGHVTSYYGPAMQKYTSFQVHESEEVRDIVTHENGIFALTKTSLRHQIRRGIPKHTFKSLNMGDMQCLYQVSGTNLMMGGHQDKLLDLDITKMTETVIPIPEEGCAVLRSGGGSTVACGSASGLVTLRDIRCPGRSEHAFQAHTACLSDLDIQGNLLITCGFTESNSLPVAEPYVLVWDVRRLKGGRDEGAWSAHTASPPLLLHFLPVFSGRAVAVSGDGHVALLHVNSQVEGQSVFQVDTQSSHCTVMDVSSTSQALVFGDQTGHLHLFSPQHNHEPVFNNFSRETEFANQAPNHPFVSFNDTRFQFSSVTMPPLTSGGKWFNELPPEFFKRTSRKPKPIDTEVLKTMKMQGPIGYAPNPGTFRRNQMPYVEDTLEDLHSPKHDMKTVYQPIPKHYQKTDTRFKHAPNEVDVENSNRTGFPGLEPVMPNSYCNPMLQVLYYTRAVKATLLSHTCAKEFCLSCELGFLFRMLDSSGGAACQATNFLRAFRTIPEAAALGLILPDRGPDPRVDYVALIQSWNRFILHQMHYEILETRKKEKELAIINSSPSTQRIDNVAPILATSHRVNGNFEEYYGHSELEFLGPRTEFDSPDEAKDGEWPVNSVPEDVLSQGQIESSQACDGIELSNQQSDREDSEISELFAIGRHQLNRCLKCNKEEERESVALACLLQYPAPATDNPDKVEREGRGFVELLIASLSSKRSTPAWCENCKRFSPTAQRGRVKRLPPILAINCGGVTAHEKAYWSKGTQKEMSDGVKRGGSGKPCRYGLHCARPGCRFKHPDRPGSSTQQNSSARSPTGDSYCVLPNQLLIRLSADGDIVINDKCEQNPEVNQSPTKSDNGAKQKRTLFPETQEQYSLSAAVVCIEDNPKNLVAYVQTGTNDEPSWYLINDLSVQRVPTEEVTQCSVWWKTPCVAFYSSSRAHTEPPLSS